MTCTYYSDLFSYPGDLPDGGVCELHLHSFCFQQRLLLLDHVVLWLCQDPVEVMRPALDTHPCACSAL